MATSRKQKTTQPSSTPSTPSTTRNRQQIYIDLTPTPKQKQALKLRAASTPADASNNKPSNPLHSTSTTTSPHPSTPKDESERLTELHRKLADELFPPSPKATEEETRERSPSVISDSEPDTPSPSPPSASVAVRKQRRERSVSEETVWLGGGGEEVESVRRDQPNEEFDGGYIRRKLDEDVTLGLGRLVLDSTLPTPSTSTTPKQRNAATLLPTPTPTSTTYTPPPSQRISKPKPPPTPAAIECICIDSSDDEEDVQQDVGRDRWTPERDDPNAGVLFYEPTPRSRKPTRIISTPQSSSRPTYQSSPSRAPIPSTPTHKNPPLKKSNLGCEIDLTGSSDSDGDSSPGLPSLSLVPRRPPPSLPRPPVRPSTTLPRARRIPAPPKVPPPAKPSESILTPKERDLLPIQLIRELNQQVFRKRWVGLDIVPGEEEGLPCAIEVRWNNKLRNTAGRASWKTLKTGSVTTHITAIDLATKVTDSREKLLHTLSHELCHIAAWILSGEVKPSHGPAFKLWAARVMSVRDDIKISTTHNYEIKYKFRWRCSNGFCAKLFQRHSRSIDPDTHGCLCGGRLQEIDDNDQIKVRKAPAPKTGWQEFLSAMAPQVRNENPGVAQSEVFKIVAEQWKVAKNLATLDEEKREEVGLRRALGRLEID